MTAPTETRPKPAKRIMNAIKTSISALHLQARAIAATYTLGVLMWLVLHLLVGERFWLVALFNHGAPLLLIGQLLAALVIISGRLYRRTWLLWSIPGLLALLIWYAPYVNPLHLLPREANADDIVLTVATYNTPVWGITGRETHLRILQAFDADIIGLQEFRNRWMIEDMTAAYPYTLIPGGVALLSRYPIVAGSERIFAEQVEPEPYIRGLRVILDVDGQQIAVYVVHPPRPESGLLPLLYDDEARHDVVQDIVNRLERETLPVILFCDCNFTDRSTDYQVMQTQLVDSWRAGGFGLGFTAPSNRPPLPLILRGDYIWHSNNIRPLEIRVWPESGADHMPVWAQLAIPE